MQVGIVGLGNIGRDVAGRLVHGAIPEVESICVTSAHLDRATAIARDLSPAVRVLALPELVDQCDVVVECATVAAFADIARAALRAGKRLVTISVAGWLTAPDLESLARRYGGSVTIANGVLPGLDMLRAAREGTIRLVRLNSQLPTSSVGQEPYVRDGRFDLPVPGGAPVPLFSGSVAEAAALFPRHMNFAVALALAGIGVDATTVELHANADIAASEHEVAVDADAVSFRIVSRNVVAENSQTSRIVALSVVSALRSLVDTVRIGG